MRLQRILYNNTQSGSCTPGGAVANPSVFVFTQICDRIDHDVEGLRVLLGLWSEMKSIANEIERWSATSVLELSDGGVHLLSSQNVEDHLTPFKVRTPERDSSRYCKDTRKDTHAFT